MAENTKNRLTRMLLSKNRRAQYLRVFAVLGVCVAVVVAVALHQNGVAMTHQEKVLTCPVTEKVAHTHNEDCYDSDGNLVCEIPELKLHKHSEECYDEDGKLICELPEVELHKHTDDCYTEVRELTCGQEESDNHKHTDDCWTTTRVLSCGKEEILEEHVHGPECFTIVEVQSNEEDEGAEEGADDSANTSGDENTENEVRSDTAKPEDGDKDAEESNVEADTEKKDESDGAKKDSAANMESDKGTEGDKNNSDLEKKDESDEANKDADVNKESESESKDSAEAKKDADAAKESKDKSEDSAETKAKVEGEDKSKADSSQTDKDSKSDSKTADSAKAAMPAKEFEDEILDEDGNVWMHVSVKAPEGAFPEGTTMSIKAISADAVRSKVEDALQKDKDLADNAKQMKAVDITFYDKDHKEIEPAKEVEVLMTSDTVGSIKHPVLVHIDKDEKKDATILKKVDVVDQDEKDKTKGSKNTLKFEADVFSPYVIVEATSLDTSVITASGETYKITVTYNPDAQIPDGATLEAKEVQEGSKEYDTYAKETAEAVDADEASITHLRMFDITIKDSEGNEIEPKAPVDVQISYVGDSVDKTQDLAVVHLPDEGKPEVMEDVTTKGTEGTADTISFTAESFSVYSVVAWTPNQAPNLNGQSFALVTGIANDPGATTGYSESWGRDYFTIIVNAHSMEAAAKNNGLLAKGVHAWSDDSGDYVGGDATEWCFEKVGNNGEYRIYTERGDTGRQYLFQGYENGSANSYVGISGESWAKQAFTLVPQRDGTVLIKKGKWYLKNNGNGEWSDRNYVMEYSNNAPSGQEYKFRLCKKSEDFDSFAARKVSVQELTSNDNFLIYRKFEDEQGNETLYALAHDGSFVRVYDGGDSVYWRETDKNVYWNYIDTGHGYSIFAKDPETQENRYLSPSHSGSQTMSDDSVGLTLLGKDTGEYGTAIENWDQASYDYAGLHVTVDANGVATLGTGTRVAGTSDEFLFARASSMPEAQRETVETVDSEALGIHITMFDYGDSNKEYNAGDKLSGMTNAVGNGSDAYTPHAAHALVKRYLTDGLPTSNTAGPMSGLFTTNGSEVTYSKTGVTNLFLQSYYAENGTFRYRSEDNYAYLGRDGQNKFTVYRQAATPYTTDMAIGHTYYYHGHFMPFNDIDYTTNLSRLMNQYGNEYTDGTVVGEIPLEDGRTYEDIYGVKGIPNFYTGMKMEAVFSQPRDGKLENGDDMVFKFTGDDDMWVYIDGILVLDIGGIHEPLSGTINFATGVVTNPTGSSLAGQTTLKEIFTAALNDQSTPRDVRDKISQIEWDGDTFADYTNHSFSAFYMERGAGASNLDIQFNLKVTLTDEFTVEKELPEGIDTRFVNEQYKFRATYNIEGREEPLHAGINNVCNAVVYKDKKDNNGNPVNVVVDNDGYFYLKPGEVAVFKMADEGISYNVREVEIDSTLNEKVEINGTEATVTDNTAGAGYAYVGNRSQVLFMNHPFKQKLMITKHITKDSAPMLTEEDPRFEFRVYLETTINNVDGTSEHKLVPYSYGPYYLVREINRETHYFTLTGNNNAPEDKGTNPVVCSTTGRSGSINSIPPEYTVVIPDLVVGTNFYVEERRDNIPEGYTFVRQELTADTYDQTDLNNIDRVLARDEADDQEFDQNMVGRIKKGKDAESHVYNQKTPKTKDFAFTKEWRDSLGHANMNWPDNTAINVTLKHNDTEYAQYNIKASDLEVGKTIAAINDNEGTKISVTVQKVDKSGYKFQLTGLPWGDENGEFTYAVSEVTVDGYQSPKYYMDGTQAMGANQIGDNGTIRNDQVGYTLPATGGYGTRFFTILGSTLVAGASIMLVMQRRRTSE